MSSRLICLCLGLFALITSPCRGDHYRLVPAGDPIFLYSGAWLTNSAGIYTIYPGSQVRFRLKGQASLCLRAGRSDSIRLVVRRSDEVVWDKLLDQGPVPVVGGTNFIPFSVTYYCTPLEGFDPATETRGAELQFEGLALNDQAALEKMDDLRKDILFDFIGDSITAGFAIHGRAGTWWAVSDATLTYAYLLAQKLGARYRMRAFSGARCDDLVDRFAFFQKGVPLPQAEYPNLVFVNIGANNRDYDASEYRCQMRRLLDVIFLTYPHTRVVLLNFMRMTPNRLPVLKELARSYPDGAVRVFDARPCLVGYSDEGVHPDVESHRRLSEALADFVTKESLLESPANDDGNGKTNVVQTAP